MLTTLQVRRWTQTAIDCYKRGCICSGEVLGGTDGALSSDFAPCPIYENYFKDSKKKCKMKYAVLESVRLFGIPNEQTREQ